MSDYKELKGFIEKTGVCLLSDKYKTFEYSEECEKKFNASFEEWVKIDLSHFKKVIKGLYEIGYNNAFFKIEGKNLRIYYNDINPFEFKINLINGNSNEQEGLYSIEYLNTFLKNFTKKEIKGEFVNIYFSQNYPLLIENSNLNTWILIAPKLK